MMILFFVLGLITLLKSNWTNYISIDTNSDNSISKYLDEQSLDSEVYKKLLEDTIPYVEDYSNVGHTSDNSLSKFFLLLTGIKWDNLNTIVEIIIPTAKYININQSEYAQNIVELEGNFDEYKIDDEQIIQNEEDYYNIEDEKIEMFEDPFSSQELKYTKAQLTDMNYLKRNLYTFEGGLVLSYEDLPVITLMNKNISINKKNNKPQVLIFHTHSQENFMDSNSKDLNEGVIGLGEKLAKIFHEEYGIGVLHHKGQYDVLNGRLMRDGSYERMEPAIKKIIKENPSIELIIDLHRDGVPDDVRLVTTIDGKPTAKIMFVNGICKTMVNGKLTEVKSLSNPYIEENLAFSLQMQLKGNEVYPGFLRKIYIKPYRYSLHMRPKSLMIEVGAQTNTLEEAQNAIEPLAKILSEVLELE